jgi:hypothetical protein
MASIVKASVNQAEKTKTHEKFKDEEVTVKGIKFHRITVDPGWQWSKHIKPIVGGENCQMNHLLYMISGTLKVKMADGNVVVFGPGDVGNIPPGHDGWNPGNDTAVWLELPR